MNDDLDIRAAEFVLGVEGQAAREAVRRDMAVDPLLREAVARWERRLSPLSAAAPSAAPPADMLARIRAALPAADNADAVIVRLHRTMRRWRAAAIASGALAASLLVFAVGLDLRTPPQGGVYVAAVNRGGDAPALIVRVDMSSGRVFVRPVAAQTPPGKSLELWVIGAGAAPRSMGLVGGAENLALPRGVTIDKAKFAVTVEPAGGSPTGGPTGPVVYAGELVRE